MFQPTDIQGCNFWFKGDSITNMRNGEDFASNLNYVWPNSSDTFAVSAPNVRAIQNESGSRFLTNVLNGHSVVSISGGFGLSTGDIPFVFPDTNELSVFYLFKHRGDESTEFATLSSYEFNYGNNQIDSTLGYAGSLNRDEKWAIMWQYPLHTLNAHFPNTVNGYRNDWIIRTDLVGSGYGYFRRNGIDILPSSLIELGGLPQLTTASFHIGSLHYTDRTNFVGEIAEVILYSRFLEHSEVLQVESYLKYKYFVGGGAAAPMMTFGSNVDTSGLYAPETTLFTEFVPMSGNIPLYMGSAYTIASGHPLYVFGVGTQEKSTELYIGCNEIAEPSSVPLVITGNTVGESALSMYIQSGENFSDNVPLYINAAPIESGNPTLFIHGRTIANSEGLPFHIQGLRNSTENNNTALYIATNTSSASTGVFGLFNTHSLFTYSASEPVGMNLYIKSEAQGENDGLLPLFINNHSPSHSMSTELFVQNSNAGVGRPAKMFVRGLGGLDGGSLGNDNMNLYIERWPADMATFFINSSTAPSSTPLYISSANSFNFNTSLMMSGGNRLMSTGIIPIYIDAGFIKEENAPMYTHGLPSSNNDSILYVNGY